MLNKTWLLYFLRKLSKIVVFFRKKYLKFYLHDFWKKYLSFKYFRGFKNYLNTVQVLPLDLWISNGKTPNYCNWSPMCEFWKNTNEQSRSQDLKRDSCMNNTICAQLIPRTHAYSYQIMTILIVIWSKSESFPVYLRTTWPMTSLLDNPHDSTLAQKCFRNSDILKYNIDIILVYIP